MTHKPKRRTSSTVSASAQGNFWGTVAAYASELAHVAGPLLEAIGQTANAINRAERQNRALEAETLPSNKLAPADIHADSA